MCISALSVDIGNFKNMFRILKDLAEIWYLIFIQASHTARNTQREFLRDTCTELPVSFSPAGNSTSLTESRKTAIPQLFIECSKSVWGRAYGLMWFPCSFEMRISGAVHLWAVPAHSLVQTYLHKAPPHRVNSPFVSLLSPSERRKCTA